MKATTAPRTAIPADIPSDWTVTSLGRCCDVLDSKRVPLSDEVRAGMKGEYPYYGANGQLDSINDWIFDEPLILMAEDGGYFGDFQNKPIAYKVLGKCWVNNHAHVLRPKDGYWFDWIFYQLEHKNVIPFINGSTRTKLNQQDLKQIMFPVASLPEQRRIAEILSTVDETIEKTDTVTEETRQLKKGLMQKLFTEGIGHTRFKETKIGRIPEEWDIVGLSDVFQVIDGDRGVNYPKSHEMHADGYCVFLNAKNVTKSGFQFNEIQFVTKEKDEILSKGKLIRGDLVLTTRGTLGNFAYFNDGVPFENLRVNSGMVVLRPLNNIIADFYYKYFNTYSMQNQIERLAFGTAQSQLTVSGIKKLKLLVPSNDEQRKIAEILSEMDAKIETEETFKSELQQLKKGLMQVLLTGKVRVKV